MPRPAATALAALLLTAPLPSAADEVVVFAAASLQSALDDVAAAFTARTGHRVLVSTAGTAALARQIVAGAPADIFLAAAPDWIEHVAEAGLVQPGGWRALFGNRLVLVGHADARGGPVTLGPGGDLAARLGDGRLAVALTASVPAGRHARQALQSLGQWDALALRLVETENVRAALALVAAGEAPFGIVYASDAAAEPRVRVLADIPAASHDPILYAGALLAGAADPGDRAFWDALAGAEAAAVFAAHGFLPLQ